MIDINKPLQLADGRTATYVSTDCDGDICVNIGNDTGRIFRPSGVHLFRDLPDLQNVPEVAPKIDWTKPIETVPDVRNSSPIPCSTRGGNYVIIDGDWFSKASFDSAEVNRGNTGWGYLPCGTSNAWLPAVRNVVPSDTLDVTKALQTVDGKAVKFIAKTDDGRLVVEVTYTSGWAAAPATELRFADGRKSAAKGRTSGDDVIVKVVEKITFRNVYADGTTGETAHASEANAFARSKYRKVRIGALKQTYKNGALVSSSLVPSATPWVRESATPKGRAAVAADYLR